MNHTPQQQAIAQAFEVFYTHRQNNINTPEEELPQFDFPDRGLQFANYKEKFLYFRSNEEESLVKAVELFKEANDEEFAGLTQDFQQVALENPIAEQSPKVSKLEEYMGVYWDFAKQFAGMMKEQGVSDERLKTFIGGVTNFGVDFENRAEVKVGSQRIKEQRQMREEPSFVGSPKVGT